MLLVLLQLVVILEKMLLVLLQIVVVLEKMLLLVLLQVVARDKVEIVHGSKGDIGWQRLEVVDAFPMRNCWRRNL